MLERLRERTGEPPGPVVRAGAAGLSLLAEGPWLSWLPFPCLARLPNLGLKPLPLVFGRRRYRTMLVVWHAAEDLAPVRLFKNLVRDISLERPGWAMRARNDAPWHIGGVGSNTRARREDR